MDRPYFELSGKFIGGMKYAPTSFECMTYEYFTSLEEAKEFAEANLEEYVIYMKMKIDQKEKMK